MGILGCLASLFLALLGIFREDNHLLLHTILSGFYFICQVPSIALQTFDERRDVLVRELGLPHMARMVLSSLAVTSLLLFVALFYFVYHVDGYGQYFVTYALTERVLVAS